MLKIIKEHLVVATSLGVIVSAAFGAGVSWMVLNSRVTALEKKVQNLSTPVSARAKICEKLMDAWIQQTGSSFSNGKPDFEQKLDAYRCVELAVAPAPPDAENAVAPDNGTVTDNAAITK